MADGTGQPVAPEDWIVNPPFDSADYLDGEPPTYAEDDEAFGEFADPELGEFEPSGEEATDG